MGIDCFIADLLRMVLIAAAVLLSLTYVLLLPATHLLDVHKPELTRVAVALCIATLLQSFYVA